MSSFLTKLQHILRKMEGLGFKCPTDIITTTKMAVVHRTDIQSNDVTNVVAGILMRPQKQKQQHWSRFQREQLANPAEDTPKC